MRETEENGETLYSVSEAVRKTGVPSHVLRYWEDELGLAIQRTSQGHRVYSESDIGIFRKVKDLKEKGLQLKAIRLLFEDTQEGRQLSQLLREEPYGRQEEINAERKPDGRQEEINAEQDLDGQDRDMAGKPERWDSDVYSTSPETAAEAEYEIIPNAETGTYQLFEKMLRSLISEAVAGQNEKLEAELAELLRDEMENLYIQLRQDAGEKEAAATQVYGRTITDPGRDGLLQKLKRICESIFRQDRY